MTDPDTLEAALADEFAGDILFAGAPPTVFSPPQIVVVPDDPFHTPGTMGAISEHWRITVAVGAKNPRASFAQLRDLSLRLARTVQKTGAVWEETRGPTTAREMVLAEAVVRFKYEPPT